VGLICSDEVSHAEGDRLLFKAFKSEIPKEVYDKAKPKMQEVFDKIVEQELTWADYVFSEGREVLGLNTKALQKYVYFVAKPCFDYLGLNWNKEVVDKNPLPYMDKYVDRSLVATANQEIENNSYRVASVDTEMPDEFDF